MLHYNKHPIFPKVTYTMTLLQQSLYCWYYINVVSVPFTCSYINSVPTLNNGRSSLIEICSKAKAVLHFLFYIIINYCYYLLNLHVSCCFLSNRDANNRYNERRNCKKKPSRCNCNVVTENNKYSFNVLVIKRVLQANRCEE